MLYQIVKPLARWILGWNFRRIYIAGKEKLPAEGPIILASNHPTAFIEPCVLASFQNRPLYFLVRGDFFKKKIFSYLLQKLHMIPVYRLKDGGYSQIKNNYTSFDTCSKSLAEGKALMILAEGTSIHEKKLRPIRKGTARIAFGAYENYQIEELPIFPVGVNYTNSDVYRSDLMLDIGEPILLSQFFDEFNEDNQKGIKLLTNSIHEEMSKNVIHLARDEDELFAEKIWKLWRNDHLNPKEELYENTNERLFKEKKISDQINLMDLLEKEKINQELESYFKLLDESGIDDLAISNCIYKRKNIGYLFFGFPIFIVGSILNIIPLLFAHAMGWFSAMSVEFRHAVRIASAIGFYGLWILLLIIIVAQINAWIIPIICILVPLLCWLSIRYIEYYNAFKKMNSIVGKSKELINSARKERKKLIERLLETNLWV